ncbi:MAG: hypothetical protein ACLUI3_05655 [Christensenellales bacterium]
MPKTIDEVVHDEFFEGLSANWTDNALGEIFRRWTRARTSRSRTA